MEITNGKRTITVSEGSFRTLSKHGWTRVEDMPQQIEVTNLGDPTPSFTDGEPPKRRRSRPPEITPDSPES